MARSIDKPKVLVFVVAYNAETTLLSVLRRIPKIEDWDVEILIIDDSSTDETFVAAETAKYNSPHGYPITILHNPKNLGYGGNQKVGYEYATTNGFDTTVLLHGDGQYPPELIPDLLAPISAGAADVVLGSRMIHRLDALKGGMPIYKWIGNQILTFFQNRLLRMRLREYHTGFRAYTTQMLNRVPFERNTDDFHFDTEILIQAKITGQKIHEIAIPTFYGDEICHVNGLRYARDVLLTSAQSCVQSFGILYAPQFDCREKPAPKYKLKLAYSSTL